jgi:hypothetical protein
MSDEERRRRAMEAQRAKRARARAAQQQESGANLRRPARGQPSENDFGRSLMSTESEPAVDPAELEPLRDLDPSERPSRAYRHADESPDLDALDVLADVLADRGVSVLSD